MKLDVYETLLKINAGFDQAIQSIAALRKHGAFHRGALARFAALSKENRAAATSYILGVIEAAETDEAGRPVPRAEGAREGRRAGELTIEL